MLRIDNAVSAEGQAFHTPFRGDMQNARQVALLASGLTTDEVTAGGYLKPGVILGAATAAALAAAVKAGTARTMMTGADFVCEGVTFEAQKIAKSNSVGDLGTAGTVQVVIGTEGAVSQKHIEEMLGRVLTANEIASFVATPVSHVGLLR